MTVETKTYGEHAENAARALNRLLAQDSTPTDPFAVDRLLHCRRGVLDALRQRLHHFGLGPRHPAGTLPAPAPGLNLESIDNKLATLLNNIACSAPNPPLEVQTSPVEVLGRPAADPVAETWREAAVELLAASHALDTAGDQPWLRDRGAGWYLLCDVAVALEAVLVLDARLAEVGLLTSHNRRAFPIGLEEKRLIASQAARVATWFATSDAGDLATPRTPGASSNLLHPVSLVSAPEDLAAAQQRLATFLRPTHAHDSTFTGEPEISADAARLLIANQLYLCRVFATMAARSPKTAGFVSFYNERAEVLESLQPQLRHLVDLNPHEPNLRRVWQQGEITAALIRMHERGIDLRLQPHQMLALANATHQVTHNLGRSLRRELLRSPSNLRDARPRYQDPPVPVARGSRLETTLTDLVNMPAPTSPVAQFSSPLQRAALRQTLDLTPTNQRPPSPYPAAVSSGGKAAPAL